MQLHHGHRDVLAARPLQSEHYEESGEHGQTVSKSFFLIGHFCYSPRSSLYRIPGNSAVIRQRLLYRDSEEPRSTALYPYSFAAIYPPVQVQGDVRGDGRLGSDAAGEDY